MLGKIIKAYLIWQALKQFQRVFAGNAGTRKRRRV